jgi:hypothetical protein
VQTTATQQYCCSHGKTRRVSPFSLPGFAPDRFHLILLHHLILNMKKYASKEDTQMFAAAEERQKIDGK